MSSSLLDLSLASLAFDAGSPRAPGAEVAIECSDEKIVTGELLRFDSDGRALELRNDDHEKVFAFSQIHWVKFLADLKTTAQDASATTSGALFHIKFNDGRMLHGYYRDVQVDHLGLHFLVEEDQGVIRRLFIPNDAVLRYRLADAQQSSNFAQEQEAPQLSPEQLSLDEPVQDAERLKQLLMVHNSVGMSQLGAKSEKKSSTKKTGKEKPADLARRLSVPLIDIKHFHIDNHVLSELPESFVRQYHIMPLALMNGHLIVAMENPADGELVNMVHFVSGRSVEGCVADGEELVSVIDRHYGAVEETDALQEVEHVAMGVERKGMSLEDMERLGREKPIVRLVHNILIDAIHRNASDIHLRPEEDEVELLYRQDGSLVSVRRFSKALLAGIVARIKILGRMDIAERRLPQDGRARMIEGDALVDMRISVIPTINGESVVIRLLNAEQGLRSIGELGFNETDAELFVDLLHKSYGMLLVTGPTGSGKSTTLYAAIEEVRKQNVNIITVEDPVEYHIAGIEQIPVNTAPGFTFARALRNILRHDPDVIMVGEIRDQETAKIAVESALTGHLVLSTLHTNDAPTAITRLIEMGVESFLVKSSVIGVLAQRLVRLNCQNCMEEEPVDALARKFLGIPEDEVFYRGAGCERCNGTGFKGRKAVYELLVMTPQMREIIAAQTPVDEIRAQALKDGMRPLTDNALEVARQKLISLAEVYRVRLE